MKLKKYLEHRILQYPFVVESGMLIPEKGAIVEQANDAFYIETHYVGFVNIVLGICFMGGGMAPIPFC